MSERPFNQAELGAATIACKMADKMCEIDPDLDKDEMIMFAYHFLLAKYALKMCQADIVREEIKVETK